MSHASPIHRKHTFILDFEIEVNDYLMDKLILCV
jgi:hypothetical protein